MTTLSSSYLLSHLLGAEVYDDWAVTFPQIGVINDRGSMWKESEKEEKPEKEQERRRIGVRREFRG